jgi:hypothetical protein
MKSTKFIKETSLVAAILLLVFFCGVGNVAAMGTVGTADKWQSEITIYGWLPSIDGELKFSIPGSGGDSATIDASDILDDLNFVFMGTYEGRYNEWSFGADIIYMDVSGSNSTTVNVGPGPGPGVPVSVSAGLGLKTWVFTGIAGYDVVQTDKARLALIGGVRYLDLSADVDIAVNGTLPPSLSGSKDFWDGIVGVKGGIMLNENWYIPYYADIGTGDSKMTWQLYAGIGYMFSWGDIKLAYRYLEYDQDDDKLVQDLKLYGPQLGIGFRF